MRETSRHLGRTFGTAAAILAATLFIGACGGASEPKQFANEPAGDYPVDVIERSFPVRQTIAKTYDMVLAVENSGDETIPAINATIGLPGEGSSLAFAYRDPQPGLAMPQRPVWVMEEGYPKLAGTVGRGGANTSNRRTFNFGELAPGETANMVWRVTAVKPGRHNVSYRISAGLSGNANAVDADGVEPGGVFPVRISNRARLTKVNRKGEVVPLSPREQLDVKTEEALSD